MTVSRDTEAAHRDVDQKNLFRILFPKVDFFIVWIPLNVILSISNIFD